MELKAGWKGAECNGHSRLPPKRSPWVGAAGGKKKKYHDEGHSAAYRKGRIRQGERN